MLGNPFSLAPALLWIVLHHMVAGEYPRGLEQSEALITPATEHGFPVWLGFGTFYQMWALVDFRFAHSTLPL